jgi:hypothetical protein
LSITTQPAAAALGACSLVGPEPAANSAMSHPAKSKCSRFWHFTILPLSPISISTPCERELATAATASIGNSRSARIASISRPTFPVAPDDRYPIAHRTVPSCHR